MIRLKLLTAALIGSYLSWIIIDNLVVPISIWQYLWIEAVIIIFHGFYNYLRDGIKAEK
jgi:hypothetical protein